jgi:hypothetical protein
MTILTDQSLAYRRKASSIGKAAFAEPHQPTMLILLQEALSWIQLAENEELLDNEKLLGIVPLDS